MASSDRPLGRLVDTRTFFFVCDMQDGFRQYIEFYEAIVTVVQRLVSSYEFKCLAKLVYILMLYVYVTDVQCYVYLMYVCLIMSKGTADQCNFYTKNLVN